MAAAKHSTADDYAIYQEAINLLKAKLPATLRPEVQVEVDRLNEASTLMAGV